MQRKNTFIILGIVFLLAIFAGFLDYPAAWNKGVDFLNAKIFSKIALKTPPYLNIPFKLGLDLQGGTHLVYQGDLSNIEKKDYSSSMQGLRDVIERRVNLFGVREPVVQIEEGSQRLIVELAGIKDVNEAIQMIGQTPFLEFKEQRTQEETQKILDKQKEVQGKSFEEAQKIPDWQLAFEDPYFTPTQLTGKYLKKSELSFDQTAAYKPLILLQFNDEGAKIFEDLTAKNVSKPLAIYIDNALLSAPVVQEKISGGKAQITGSFTIEEAKKIVQNLNAGALPVPIKLISQQTVGPSLGEISLKQSLRAGIIGFLAVILFLIIFYRIPGIFAGISLIIYVIFVLSLFKLISVTLTLAGIAGFILSMGMAIDANILIFSRMREELKQGKSYLISLEDGFKRAWPAIRDGNFTTILVGLILFGLGTGFVKGFAFTLILGNLVGMFSAIFITNNLLKLFSKEKQGRLVWLWR